MILICLLFCILNLASTQAVLKKVTLQDPTALCLDGSPGVYYIERGQYPKTIVLYFEGGGWCGDKDLASTIENCYQRSKTNYGSSKSYPATVSYSDGILSDNHNNEFRYATRIILRYCDGSGHQGTKSSPIVYKDAKLYFRGNNITIAQLNDIEAKEGLFSKATQIIVTGGSAGGLAAFLWADYIKQKASTQNVVAVPDSGIFLNFPTYDTNETAYLNQFQNIFKISNQQISPPVTECAKAYKNQQYKCMLAEYMWKYIKTPIFAVQSLYDSWSIANILHINCLTGSSMENCSQGERNYIQQYRDKTASVMKQISKVEGNGIWGLGCATHGFVHDARLYSQNFRIPMNSQNSIDAAVLAWVENQGQTHIYMDEERWPSNKPCSGIHSLQKQ